MSTEAFGQPGMDVHPSGEDRHVDLPENKTRPSSGGGNTGRRVFLRSWLDTTAWWTEPRPAISTLLVEAREGEWTVKQWHRLLRRSWLNAAARTGRVLPWLAGRWTLEPHPALWGELPAVRDVADDEQITRWPDMAYRVANWLSWVADSATRTGVFLVSGWLCANWANNVPILHYLVPDQVTAAYWWMRLAAWWNTPSAPESTPTPPSTLAPTQSPPPNPAADLTSNIGQLAFVAIVLAFFVWRWWRNRNKPTTPPGDMS